MDCWKCGKKIGDAPLKIGFRATCPHCEGDLHVCKNCRYYAPGKPNDCSIPGTEFIKDREAYNFCEEFSPKHSSPPPDAGSHERARRILGSDEPLKKGDFNSLFKEEETE